MNPQKTYLYTNTRILGINEIIPSIYKTVSLTLSYIYIEIMSAVSHELCIILEVGATLINYMHITDTYTRIESILPLKKNQ